MSRLSVEELRSAYQGLEAMAGEEIIDGVDADSVEFSSQAVIERLLRRTFSADQGPAAVVDFVIRELVPGGLKAAASSREQLEEVDERTRITVLMANCYLVGILLGATAQDRA